LTRAVCDAVTDSANDPVSSTGRKRTIGRVRTRSRWQRIVRSVYDRAGLQAVQRYPLSRRITDALCRRFYLRQEIANKPI